MADHVLGVGLEHEFDADFGTVVQHIIDYELGTGEEPGPRLELIAKM